MNVEISKVTTKTRVKGYIIHELNGKNGKMEKILIQKTKKMEKRKIEQEIKLEEKNYRFKIMII